MSQVSAYTENSVTTQSKGRLVVMLYDGAIKFINQAIVAMNAKDMTEKGRLIGRATDILVELDCELDMEAGGEIAQNLRNLYGFMQTHLTKAHLANDEAMMREVISLLTELNEGWRAITGG